MGLEFFTGATGFLGRNLLGALMRETKGEYLVMIRTEQSKERIMKNPCLSIDPPGNTKALRLESLIVIRAWLRVSP